MVDVTPDLGIVTARECVVERGVEKTESCCRKEQNRCGHVRWRKKCARRNTPGRSIGKEHRTEQMRSDIDQFIVQARGELDWILRVLFPNSSHNWMLLVTKHEMW